MMQTLCPGLDLDRGTLEMGALLCGKQNGHARCWPRASRDFVVLEYWVSLKTSKCYWRRELNGEQLFCKPRAFTAWDPYSSCSWWMQSIHAAFISTPIITCHRHQHPTLPLHHASYIQQTFVSSGGNPCGTCSRIWSIINWKTLFFKTIRIKQVDF